MLVRLRRALALCLVLGFSAAAFAWPPTQETTVFRAQTQTVPVYVTVVGPDDRLVTGLSQDDFVVLDNGRPQPLVLFDAGVQPISIVVMLDMSGSMLGNITTLRRAAAQLFSTLLPADKARVGSFGFRIQISPTFTNDTNELIRALWLDLESGGPTPLWGAVNAAMSALAPLSGRRVVLVLSDGKNTGFRTLNGTTSGPALKDVSARAQAEDFMIYAIGMRSSSGPGAGLGPGRGRSGGSGRGTGGATASDEPDPGLRELALQTGGGYVDLARVDELGPAFERVSAELHRQYLLGYLAPESDGKVHQVEVRVRDTTLRTRARRTYVAPTAR